MKAQYEKALVDKPGSGAFSSVLDDLYKQALELSVPDQKEAASVFGGEVVRASNIRSVHRMLLVWVSFWFRSAVVLQVFAHHSTTHT